MSAVLDFIAVYLTRLPDIAGVTTWTLQDERTVTSAKGLDMHLQEVLGGVIPAHLLIIAILAPQSTVLQEGLWMGIGPLLAAGLEMTPEISELVFLIQDLKGGLQILQSVEIGLLLLMLMVGIEVGLSGLQPWIGDIESAGETAIWVREKVMKGEHHLHLIHQYYHLVANGHVIPGKEAVLQWEVDHRPKTIAVMYTWEGGEMIGGLDEVHISWCWNDYNCWTVFTG